MLALARRVYQEIHIGPDIRVAVMEIGEDTALLGIQTEAKVFICDLRFNQEIIFGPGVRLTNLETQHVNILNEDQPIKPRVILGIDAPRELLITRHPRDIRD